MKETDTIKLHKTYFKLILTTNAQTWVLKADNKL